jgi:HPt (histidine-containing phosphotransfer) domain-containing protein
MDSPAIDLVTFSELKETMGADFVSELVDTFLEEAPGMLAELRSALADNHAVRFRRAAHSLKSNCYTFGAAAMGAMARDLEIEGLEAGARLDALDAAYARAASTLRELRDA